MKRMNLLVGFLVVGFSLSFLNCGKPDGKDALIDYYVKTIEFSKTHEYQTLKSDENLAKCKLIEKSEEIAKSCGFQSLAHLVTSSQEFAKDPDVIKLREEYKKVQKNKSDIKIVSSNSN